MRHPIISFVFILSFLVPVQFFGQNDVTVVERSTAYSSELTVNRGRTFKCYRGEDALTELPQSIETLQNHDDSLTESISIRSCRGPIKIYIDGVPVSSKKEASYTYKGVVKDDNGIALPFAAVLVEGEEALGVMTDFDGRFEIISAKPSLDFTLRSVGHKEKTFTGQKPSESIEFTMDTEGVVICCYAYCGPPKWQYPFHRQIKKAIANRRERREEKIDEQIAEVATATETEVTKSEFNDSIQIIMGGIPGHFGDIVGIALRGEADLCTTIDYNNEPPTATSWLDLEPVTIVGQSTLINTHDEITCRGSNHGRVERCCWSECWTDSYVTDDQADNDTVETKSIEEEEISISLYPNPSQYWLNVRLSAEQDASYQIMDLSGKLMATGQVKAGIARLDVSNYAPGSYIFLSSSQDGQGNSAQFIVSQ